MCSHTKKGLGRKRNGHTNKRLQKNAANTMYYMEVTAAALLTHIEVIVYYILQDRETSNNKEIILFKYIGTLKMLMNVQRKLHDYRKMTISQSKGDCTVYAWCCLNTGVRDLKGVNQR